MKRPSYRKVKDLDLICPKCKHKRKLRIYDRLDIDIEDITPTSLTDGENE